MTPRPTAFDRDAHLGDVETQQAVTQALRTLGVSLGQLTRALQTEESHAILGEYVAMKREVLFRRVGRLITELEAVVNAGDEDGLLSDAFFTAAHATHETLCVSVGTAGQQWAEDSRSRARVRRTRFPKRAKLAISNYPSTARGLQTFVRAVQRLFMPEMRRRAYEVIMPAVRRRARARARAFMVRCPNADRAEVVARFDRGVQAETSRHTADFIRAFYPTFGARTTAGNVRKALRIGK